MNKKSAITQIVEIKDAFFAAEDKWATLNLLLMPYCTGEEDSIPISQICDAIRKDIRYKPDSLYAAAIAKFQAMHGKNTR